MRKIVGFSAGDGFAQLLLSGGGRVRLRVGDDWDELAARYANVDFDATAARDALEKSDLLLADMRESLKREHQHCLNAEHIACAQAKRASEAEEGLRAALRAKESACDAYEHEMEWRRKAEAALASAEADVANLTKELKLARTDANQWAKRAARGSFDAAKEKSTPGDCGTCTNDVTQTIDEFVRDHNPCEGCEPGAEGEPRTRYAPRAPDEPAHALKTLEEILIAAWLSDRPSLPDKVALALRHVVDLVRDLARATFRGPNTTEGLAEVERRCDALLGE